MTRAPPSALVVYGEKGMAMIVVVVVVVVVVHPRNKSIILQPSRCVLFNRAHLEYKFRVVRFMKQNFEYMYREASRRRNGWSGFLQKIQVRQLSYLTIYLE